MKFVCALVLLLATPALAAPMTTWDAKKDGEGKVYNVQGLSLKLASGKDKDGDAIPTLTISQPGTQPFTINGDQAINIATLNFAAGHFDPKSPGAQVLVTSYTGGAHCCDHVLLAERLGAGWRLVDMGLWDGAGDVQVPTDIDGDGAADFVFVDNEFYYVFDSYAASWAPPKILNVIDGKVVDVSTNPQFHKVFEADMAKAQKYCVQKQNGVCAAYVADGARAEQFDAAWKFMLAHYDPKANWDLPTRCVGTVGDDGTCKGQELKPRDYPQALHWFLEDHHYIPKQAGD
jgi:hypothetical protein